jgi:ubiquinone/menaquinone biosynthesis C-methylase UbiE
MAEHENVYKDETERYHALVSFEDHKNNLNNFIQRKIPSGTSIFESGAGTGRITKIVSPIARSLVSCDLSLPMVTLANHVSNDGYPGFLGYSTADHRYLPFSNGIFNWVISGWSVCYLVSWQRDRWKTEVCRAIMEFSRIVRSDGQILLIETLGTGKTSPEPPPHLVAYLSFLEEIGFQKDWIRTDYEFPNFQTAQDLTGFFFGQDMLAAISVQVKPQLPECTGLWYGKAADIRKNLPE